MKKIVLLSGGFDPIHSGHISLINESKKLGNLLIIALNSDKWLINKKGKFFMPFSERKNILENINNVDLVIDFKDDDQGSAINAIKKVQKMYPKSNIVFSNGGDRNKTNIPEMSIKDIAFEFGVGGSDKKNSSSWILKNYKFDYEDRIWGKFYELFSDEKVKLKELIIHPSKGISYQRHFLRNEIWFISKGSCMVKYSHKDPDNFNHVKLNTDDTFLVKNGCWHQIYNTSNEQCHVIEIQYGQKRSEDDIERHSYYKID